MYHFSKTRRLLKKSDFEYVFKQASKIATSELIILYRDSAQEKARLGLAISKKVVPKAHDRNRIKRVVRETFRTSELPAVDMIVLGKRGVSTVPNSVMMTRLSKAWEKLSASLKE